MSTAAIDQNSKQTITARLKTDGVTIKRAIADAATGKLGVTNNTAGAVTPSTFAASDENGRTSWFAVSELDSKVLVAIQCDSSGNILVKFV